LILWSSQGGRVESRPGIRNDQANVLIVRKHIWRGWHQETREVIE
jgi:hypothetical protein